MASQPSTDVTQILVNWESGDQDALEQLMPLVYGEAETEAQSRSVQLTADWSFVMYTPGSDLDRMLRTAIDQRRLLRLVYLDKERIVEPHDYGIHNGTVKLFGYQVGGSSSGKLPSWRWMETDLILDSHLLNRTFPGGRTTPSGKHHKWDELFARVKPAGEE